MEQVQDEDVVSKLKDLENREYSKTQKGRSSLAQQDLNWPEVKRTNITYHPARVEPTNITYHQTYESTG